MIKKMTESEIGKELIGNDNEFEKLMMEHINLYKYKIIEKNKHEYEIDKLLGKNIITHLQLFFNRSTKNKTIKNKTIKNKGNKRNKTIKKNYKI